MADAWWNDKYFIRRQLIITPDIGTTIEAGYPLFARFDYITFRNSNKVREDLADIEVLYINYDSASPVWAFLPKEVYFADTSIYIKFNAVERISLPSNEYYIYMSNPTLVGQPVVAAYTSADYVIHTSIASGLGLTYTRPTEDWIDGMSQKMGAKATFTFFGVNTRLVVEKGPDRGILELVIDNTTTVLIDTYALTETNAVVWPKNDEPTGLTLGKHYFRMRTTGDKNPSSTGTEVKIAQFEYSRYTQGVDNGEEINSSIPVIRILVGP